MIIAQLMRFPFTYRIIWEETYLRMFVLTVSAHPYCAQNSPATSFIEIIWKYQRHWFTYTTYYHTCQPPEYKNLETSRNLCILTISFKTMYEYSLKIRPGDLMKNLETPGKIWRVGRYVKCTNYTHHPSLSCLGMHKAGGIVVGALNSRLGGLGT